ncbi:thiamine phosphate synthase [Candidatus Pelagibacter sp.]|nr:thiamine phosphate synthase [Candidatus Pelagibacter sp.]MDB3975434.1 thiamine phosphate synthase [Candidatus Pelagibacter sp.]MDC0621369.1 thiamine phosphate synthase [Candidatus Pelagibacter sp.]MDC1154223.1 thiamine phosphate synthase [Candidatus Pelagibacter sp.]
MRISKKKFIYLISPNNIYPQFYQDLNKVLETRKVGLFQLRLKKYSFKQKILIGKKIQRICKKNSVKFIVNDDPILSKKLNADGCHLGQKDMNINSAKKIIGNKIIGITCHNSIKLAKAAIKEKASYIAFGAFFSTKTKKVKFKAKIEILNKAKKLSQTPIVAIGGININNYKKLLLNNANLLAISGYVWNNKKYKPLETIEKLK